MREKYAPHAPTHALGVPDKFLSTGEIQRLAGVSVICHIPTTSGIIAHLQRVYKSFEDLPELATYARLLPPVSWHMTVLNGVRERECQPGKWPEHVPKLSYPDMIQHLTSALRDFARKMNGEGLGPPYRMRCVGFDPAQCGMGLALAGVGEAEEARMRRLRTRLAEETGIHAPDHASYGFHISIGYLLETLEGDRKGAVVDHLEALEPSIVGQEVTLGSLELCTFENMDHFEQVYIVQP